MAALNPVSTILRFESEMTNNCATAHSTSSSASGCGQMIDSTWKSTAQSMGLDTAQYPTMDSAPVNIQMAAIAKLYQDHGFSDYTCSGCNEKLTNYVNSVGGESAFAARGALSTNPADYLALNQPDGVADWVAANGGAVAGVSPGAAASQLTQSGDAQIGTWNRPFTATTQLYTNTISRGLELVTNDVVTAAHDISVPLLTLALMIGALGLRWGHGSLERYGGFVARVLFVITMLGSAGKWYQDLVATPFLRTLPTWFASIGSSGASSIADIASGFDTNLAAVVSAALAEAGKLHFDWGLIVFYALVLLISTFVIAVAIGLMFIAWFGTYAILQVVVTIGALSLLFLVFNFTRRWFSSSIGALIALSLGSFAINVLVRLMSVGTSEAIRAAMPSTGGTVLGFVSVAIMVIGLGLAVWQLRHVFHLIGAAGSQGGAALLAAPAVQAAVAAVSGGTRSARQVGSRRT